MDHRWQLSPQFSNCADASDPLILARLAAAHTPSFLRFYAESSFRYTQVSYGGRVAERPRSKSPPRRPPSFFPTLRYFLRGSFSVGFFLMFKRR
jgi:hypothetical protein